MRSRTTMNVHSGCSQLRIVRLPLLTLVLLSILLTPTISPSIPCDQDQLVSTMTCTQMSKPYARPDAQSDSDDMDLGISSKEEPRNKPALVVMCDEENDLPTVAILDPNRPHSCRICAKTFKRKPDMKRHEANHSGKKPWRCSECNKCFARKDNAVAHQLLHSDNPKPWFCPVCKKNFSSKQSAKKHVNKVHGFDLPEIPKKEKQTMAVIGNEGDLVDTLASPRGAIDAVMTPSKPGKEGNAPPVDDMTLTPSPGRKRKLAQDCDVDSVIDYSQPASNASPTQSVKRAKRNAKPKGKQKERKPSVSSSDHDSGFDEEYQSSPTESPQSNGSSLPRADDSDEDHRNFKFKFDYSRKPVAEME